MGKIAKFYSRKFLVWFVASVFVVIAYKFKDPSVINTAYTWWGTISLAYIGGNVAKTFIHNKRESNEQ